jgi:SAM-dependent MidA family methyltransferase
LGGSTVQVRWFSGWDELPTTGVRGVIFANELLDALPVHLLGWDAAARRWFEWGVTTAGDGFGWTRLTAPPGRDRGALSAEGAPPWPDLPEELLAVLPNGFTVEISSAAREWWTAAAQALSEGILLTLDYGYDADEAVRPERTGGTARAYAAHHLSAAVLEEPGLQDLTVHVDFGALRAAGQAAGLTTVAFVSQGQFLTRVVEQMRGTAPPFPAWTPAWRRQFQTLTHPDHLGRAFRVLVQRRVRR